MSLIPGKTGSSRTSGVRGILQRPPGLEGWRGRRRDLHLFARARIAPGVRRPVPSHECAETLDSDFISARQRLGDHLEQAVDGILRGGLAHSCPACQALRQFRPVHRCAPVFAQSVSSRIE